MKRVWFIVCICDTLSSTNLLEISGSAFVYADIVPAENIFLHFNAPVIVVYVNLGRICPQILDAVMS